jgi:hypothetical protein
LANITSAGLAAIAGLVSNVGSVTAFTYVATGTGTTVFGVAQTTLVAEITDSGLARATVTPTRTTTTATNDTIQWQKAFSVTGTKTVGEVGILNDPTTGILLCRNVLSPTKSVTSGDTLTVTYTMPFSNA